jgi:hypothetical protein
MTLYFRLFVVFFFLSPLFTAQNQNYFTIDNSRSYANFLLNNQEYELAMSEYSRILIDSNYYDEDLVSKYFSCAKKTKNFSPAIRLYENIERADFSIEIQDNYLKLLFLNREFKTLNREFKTHNSLLRVSLQKSMLLVSDSLLDKNEFHQLLEFHHLSAFKKNFKYKNPYLAGTLSAALPGFGKFYTGYKKDAIVSFLYVGVTTFQGLRGFKKNGIKSGYGWVFSSLACSFYLGNIYGSYKSALKRNLKNKRHLNEAVNRIYN